MLVLLGIYLMAQYTARTNVAMCKAENLCASQPRLYNTPRDGKGRSKPDRRCADRPVAPMLSLTAAIWLFGRRTRRPSGRRSLRRHLAAGAEGPIGVLLRWWLAARQAVLHRHLRPEEAVEEQGHPMGGGYKQHHEDITGTSKSSKRRRKIDIVHLPA